LPGKRIGVEINPLARESGKFCLYQIHFGIYSLFSGLFSVYNTFPLSADFQGEHQFL
jgi:hypothetical protein